MVATICMAESSNPPLRLKLQQEELRFTQFLMERVPEPIFWIEPIAKPNAKVLYVNQAVCHLVGSSREQLVSMGIQDLNLDFLLNVWANFCKTDKQQHHTSFNTQYQRKDGYNLSLEITVTAIESEGKKYSYLLICHIKSQTVASGTSQPQVFQNISSQEDKPKYPSLKFPGNTLLNQVFNFIEGNYHQPISLCDVATAVGYCPAYLTNLVRRHTGKTVNHWIVERRMLAARNLLKESDLSVSQIAEAVGYQHEGHFFRQFRQNHKTTPQAWRKSQFICNGTSSMLLN
ncbi:helix-turn-helix domain-containing protein [Nostoc sp. FACHB-87]|uniref:helix-turn-helix domain-containing protein n=1 Tax=Nostocales TaxID=1161 RepID=UPI001684CFF1|nr:MULTISPECIES: AraC family transcriptional regulator [Nostocales]MBD2299694.1 helix-turn-helix domain-containing protein [Nostoc sp. FACHB-190]MBD2457458.1 helix-turn-helix domain-containing protein [Nostoc sp. FACHB-87]MBD2477574.1 helix-turn-helix domain-containing protein [Anabaena sp. FACHB-83]MBD2489601.1 helix-turn-helix domain-containing protein [Aulosira sp. FACHB-615]